LESNLQSQTKQPLTIFKPALDEIQNKIQIPILLPSKLPTLIRVEEIKGVFGEVTKNGYFVSLGYAEVGSNATYAAGFSGSKEILPSPSNTRLVTLNDGTVARFRPVSCGGSCAPANLWWVRDGVEYGVQIKISSTAREEDQQKVLIETANSMVLARKN
jgi:hypothetical protein